MDFASVIIAVGGFAVGSLYQRLRQKDKYIKTLTEQTQKGDSHEKMFRFNDNRKNDPRLLDQSVEAEDKVSREVPEYLVDTLVEEVPYILFTLTYNKMEKHWMSQPKGKILITEDRVNDKDHVYDRIRLYVNNKEFKLERHEQIRIVNAVISVNNNVFNCEGKA